MKKMNKQLAWLTESAVMIALATILSLLKIFDLPYGGSITVGSMLPMIIVAYRYGVGKGMITGLVYSAIQLLCGLSALSYATSWVAAVAIIMLDYIIAFAVTGLGGVFRKKFKDNQTAGIMSGALLVCVLRFICHVISGCTVWAGVSIPSSDGLIYSLSYNATYMLPETIIVLVLAWYVSGVIDFSGATLRPAKRDESKKIGIMPYALTAIGLTSITAAVIYDVTAIFGVLQNPDTGALDFSTISSAPWNIIGIVTAVGIVLLAVFCVCASIVKNKRQKAE